MDVILGGGEERFPPPGTPGAFPDNPPEDPSEQSSSNRGNLIQRAQQLGYQYVNNAEGLQRAKSRKLLGLFANEEMFQQEPEGQGDIYDPVVTLEQMTRKAIEVLSRDDDGFLLIVEEEAVDEFSHANNSRQAIKGVRELDKAVRVGRRFADREDETLVLVTADHECGGLAIEGLDDPRFPDESGDTGSTNANVRLSGEDGPFAVAGSKYQFKTDWTTTGHTAVDVPLTAEGPEAFELTGNYEYTAVARKLAEALDLGKLGGAPPDLYSGVRNR